MKSEPGFSGFPDATFRFLRGLSKNNDKAWFDAHRDDYESGYVAPAKAFVSALGPRLQKISKTVSYEPRVNGSLFRINRDIRFSKDKTPYKNHLDLWFWEGESRGWGSPGFFFRMYEDKLILGGGMHSFEKAHLEAFRAAVVDPKRGKALQKALDEVRGSGPYVIGGASRKKVPRGFDADHERAPLLLHEALSASYEGDVPDNVGTSAFVETCAEHFRAVWPVSRWLLSVLPPLPPRAR